jgi:uncharacterized protein YraI
VVGVIVPGDSYTVTGRNADSSWFQINHPGGAGWVAASVTQRSGDCGNVPLAASPPTASGATATPTPTGSVTPTRTPTATQPSGTQEATQPSQPSATVPQPTATFTYTATQASTATYTPSYTPTVPAPTAPPDANFNNPLNIPLDSTASVTDFVSYPGGDREDRVRWDITGMNPNSSLSGGRARLILAVSCFGTGTQNITFFTGGQTYSCGQTIIDREVTYDSRTGQVTITAVAGEDTYVQWVLTGTATRVN